MPFYFPPVSGGGSSTPSGPTPPPAPKTANYTFVPGDSGVPIEFQPSSVDLVGTLPNPLTVDGMTFIAKKIGASVSEVTLTGAMIDGSPVYSLIDQNASVVLMASNGAYIVIASHTP